MIPISQDERFKVKIDGVTYLVKPLTGANEVEYLSIAEGVEKGKSTRKEQFEALDKMVDFLCDGWEGKGVPKFPADGKPSKYLNSVVKNRLVSSAGDLNTMTADEAKN